jgi:serine/threonine-protein kinase
MLNTAAMEARVGTILADKYRLDRILGMGGMGAVFDAENTWLARRVAIKVMHPDVSRDQALVERFLREARAAARVHHPNVVDVLDLGQDADGTLFIVQEFLPGTDLEHLMRDRGPLPPREALEIIVPVMSALIAAHRSGVLHRDVKPANVLLANSPGGGVTPKLLDFGIAKMQEAVASKDLTQTGIALGTVHYFSPEQAAGARDVDAQSDVWALAVVLYEMLSGRCPWEGETVNQIFAAVLTAPVPPIQSFAPNVPDALAAVIMRALERDRTVRFRSMQEFLGALLDCSTFERESWHTTMRMTHRAATSLDNAPIESERPGTNVLPVAPSKATPPRMTTFGRTAREIMIPAPGMRGRFTRAIAITMTACAVAVTIGLLGRHVPGPAAPIPVTRPTPTFEAVFDVDGATIEIDGVPMGTGHVAVTLPIDGRNHVARCYAPGRIERRIVFRDSLPPTRIALEPIAASVVVTPAPVALVVIRHARAVPAPVPVPVLARPVATPPTRPVTRTRNGAPILGLDE